ncbi:hypothetical protein NIES4074_03690 [Cylindrospermum sp. NIES-4074]|nr:hypothetical protein NIES4074_03690 [Cylindrospermum sp. NIES-4074]
MRIHVYVIIWHDYIEKHYAIPNNRYAQTFSSIVTSLIKAAIMFTLLEKAI